MSAQRKVAQGRRPVTGGEYPANTGITAKEPDRQWLLLSLPRLARCLAAVGITHERTGPYRPRATARPNASPHSARLCETLELRTPRWQSFPSLLRRTGYFHPLVGVLKGACLPPAFRRSAMQEAETSKGLQISEAVSVAESSAYSVPLSGPNFEGA